MGEQEDAEKFGLEDEARTFLEGVQHDERCIFCGNDPYHYVDVGMGGKGVRAAVVCCDHGIALYQHGDDGLARAASTIEEAGWIIERLLKALEMKPGWSLDRGYRNGDEEDDYGWIVFEVRGGINDREWEEIGFGETPLEALQSAIEAAHD